MPQEFSLLPEDGKVAGSDGYQPGSLLGLEELRDCLYADYEGSEGATWGGFVVLPSAASAVWEALADRWESFEHDGLTVLFREVPYSGPVGVTRTDSGMFGVSGAADETQLRERLAGFARLRLTPPRLDSYGFRVPTIASIANHRPRAAHQRLLPG